MNDRKSETPRTGAIKYVQSHAGNGTGVYTFQGHYSAAITLCSQLERELTAAHEQIAKVRAETIEECARICDEAARDLAELSDDNEDDYEISECYEEKSEVADTIAFAVRALQEKAK